MSATPDELSVLYDAAVKTPLLSPRELQVLWLWSNGAGIRKSADLLDCSASTVREHRRRLFRKLQEAATRGELARP